MIKCDCCGCFPEYSKSVGVKYTLCVDCHTEGVMWAAKQALASRLSAEVDKTLAKNDMTLAEMGLVIGGK